jgi:hypothetical protein
MRNNRSVRAPRPLRYQPGTPDLPALLRRPDLTALGFVLVTPGGEGTITVWCAPDVDPEPHLRHAHDQGQALAALLLVFPTEAVGLVQPEWQAARWLKVHIEHTAAALQQAGGLDGFVKRLSPGSLVVEN